MGSGQAVADVARYDFGNLRELCVRPGVDVSRRDEFEDVGRALRHTARLLWGERVTDRFVLDKEATAARSSCLP